MRVAYDVRSQLEKLDQQILDMLAERAALCRELRDEGDGVRPEEELDVLANWEEGAADRGVDESAVSRVCKAVLLLCRREA